MNKKLGLVMTGGGARAAYQVGVVRAIYEITNRKHNLFEVITGNSAGAINSTYLAANAENWDVATHNLTALWGRVKPENVFDLRTRTISELGLKWMSGTLLGGLTPKGSTANHLLDTAPLRKLAQREINFEDIIKNLKQGHLHGVSLSTTNYNSGSNVVFYQGHEKINDWSRSDRFSLRCDIKIDHLMASAAIPFFFPPVQIGQSFFGDGCIRQTTPLSPAIHLGADKIIGIGVRYPRPHEQVRHMALSPFQNPTIGQIAGVMLNAIFMDALEADVERMRRINELIAEGAHKELKSIPILMIKPSRDLGKMSAEHVKELPQMLRYLLKGIGVAGNEGTDLLSYLAFDSSYTKPLVELGYDDTMKMKEEIRKFTDDV
ncbi:patatin-like phospholipase family protein [Peredibacter sp. HCB2-198]|uniref:patatin-like phospholipase family protein n=1 Tax=Peredibacter sp. HCB2-198 TaxID=3383025 RepID=UPI0038B48F38